MLHTYVSTGFGPGGYIFADKGYANSNFVLTPWRSVLTNDAAKRMYNKCHKSARVLIENTFGLWKKSFQFCITVST